MLDVGNIRGAVFRVSYCQNLQLVVTQTLLSHTLIWKIVLEDNPNPPDLSQAPEGPYIKDRASLSTIGSLVWGTTNLDIFIPSYNYKVDEAVPFSTKLEADHYEETNSLGPSAYPIIETEIHRLLEWMNQ